MKVAYINCLTSRRGLLGVEKKIEAQTRAIHALGLDMDVFLFDMQKRSAARTFRFYPQATGTLGKRLAVFYRYGQVTRRIDTEAYDYLVLRYAGGDFSAFCPLFTKAGKKIITEHHTKEGPETYTYKSSLPQRVLTILMERFLGPVILKKCKGVIAVTDEIKAYELTRLGVSIPSCTIPNGISVDEIPFTGHAPYDGHRLDMLCLANRFDAWQGLDRLISGMARYGRNRPALRLNVVGNVAPEHMKMAKSVLDDKMERIAFHGRLEGDALEKMFRKTHIAFSALAMFRKKMNEACALKTREFVARGLPFVLAHQDPDLRPAPPFAYHVPTDESPIDMGQVAAFAERVLPHKGVSNKMRTFALTHLDWKIKIQQMWDFLEGLS